MPSIPTQADIDTHVRAWVSYFLGPSSNPVLYAGNTVNVSDVSRHSTGVLGFGLNATVLVIAQFLIGEPNRNERSEIWFDVEAEYSIQFFWRGPPRVDESGYVETRQAQSAAASFAIWAHTPYSREFLSRKGLALLHTSSINDLTDLPVTEAEKQDRAGVTMRIGYTQMHDGRPQEIAGIASAISSGVHLGADHVYDVTIDDLNPM